MSIPDTADYIDSARQFAVKVAERVDENDEERRIPADLAGELADAGFFRLLVPESLGGVEIEYPAFVEIVRIFARADASTAWCVNQNNIFATDSARMPIETARKIWGDPRGIVTNGPPSRDTNSVPAEGGYRLSGHWGFSSGSSHSTWLAARGPVEGRAGETRTFLVPKASATMLDMWHVSGLRGTASLSFEIDDLFVPESHTYLESDAPHEDGPIYVIPKVPMFSIGFATISIELARACLDDAIELAVRKTQHGIPGAMIDRSTVQQQIGENEANLRAADAYLRKSETALWDSACRRGELGIADRVEVRMASTHAIRQSARVVDAAYEISGADAIFKHNLLQCRYQDMHVITQQFQGRAANFETAGRYFLGLEVGGSL